MQSDGDSARGGASSSSHTQRPHSPPTATATDAQQQHLSKQQRRPPKARACDQCNARRIRCVGDGVPCQSCVKSQLDCTFEKQPRKKGPRGVIMSKLRQQSSSSTSQPASKTDAGAGLHHPAAPQDHVHPSSAMHLDVSPPGATLYSFGATNSAAGAPTVTTTTSTHSGASGHSPPFATLHSSLPLHASHLLASTSPSTVDQQHRHPQGPSPTDHLGFDHPLAPPNGHNNDSHGLSQDNTNVRLDVTDFFQLNSYLNPTPSGPTPPAHNPSPNSTGGESLYHSSLSNYFMTSVDMTNQLGAAGLLAPPPPSSRHPGLTWIATIVKLILEPQIDVFFARLHLILPMIPRSYIQAGLDTDRHLTDPPFAALVLAIASFALVGPVSVADRRKATENQELATALQHECLRVKGMSLSFEPTLDTIWTLFFLFGSAFNLEQHQEAWWRLREALTLAETLELHRQEAYDQLSMDERSRRIRTLWVLMVTERAYAMQKNHSIVFNRASGVDWALSDIPWLSAYSGEMTPMLGLRCLAHLYSFINEDIVSCWNGKCLEGVCETMDAPKVVTLQRGLDGWAKGISETLMMQLTEPNRADLLVSQQWLRNRIWQLTVSHCLADQDSPELELRLSYSLLIARETVRVCRSFTQDALEANGVGVAHKLHDIVLSVIYSNRTLGDAAPDAWMGGTPPVVLGQHLRNELTQLLRDFRGGKHPFLQSVLVA
ncbi:hypothetical protein OIV83_006280 [Microbotryomycetes sp. JL201]|nr:hypothetical protein OIV83_006280 [Microbotryomycetes sp. JL201]